MQKLKLPENKMSASVRDAVYGAQKVVNTFSSSLVDQSRVLNSQKPGETGQLHSQRVYLAGVGYSAYVATGDNKPSTLRLNLGYSDIKTLEIPAGTTAGSKSGTQRGCAIEVLVVDRSVLNPSIASGASSLSAAKADTKSASDASPIKAVIIIRGTDKECVNSFAASIRQLRPLSRYQGIGVSLENEYSGRKIISSAKKKK